MTDELSHEIDQTGVADQQREYDASSTSEGLSENGGPPKANREERIRTRAFFIWEGEGAPHGRDLDHWQQSESEIDSDTDDSDNLLPTMDALREASLEHTNAFLDGAESKARRSGD